MLTFIVVLILRLTDERKFNYSVSALELGKGKIYRKFFHVPRVATWAGILQYMCTMHVFDMFDSSPLLCRC